LENHQVIVDIIIPIPMKSIKVDQNSNLMMLVIVFIRKAIAKASDATQTKRLRITTKAGSSLAH